MRVFDGVLRLGETVIIPSIQTARSAEALVSTTVLRAASGGGVGVKIEARAAENSYIACGEWLSLVGHTWSTIALPVCAGDGSGPHVRFECTGRSLTPARLTLDVDFVHERRA